MEDNNVKTNNLEYYTVEDLKNQHFKYVEYVTSEEFKQQHPEHVAYLESEEFKKNSSKYLKYLDSEEAKEIIASTPKYVPEPLVEYNPDDFKPVEFDECFKPLIEHFKRIQSEPTPKFNTTEGSMSMFQISHGGI
jgi:hypothetical protein